MKSTICNPAKLLPVLFAVAFAFCHSRADDTPTQKINGWQRLFRKHAAEYKIVVQGNGGGDATLVPDPVLQWNQPVRGGSDGEVFVWTLDGRPIAIGTLFIWPMSDGKQSVTHELHSLSQFPIVASRQDRRWTPPRDSMVWKAIPQSPVPAATPEQRMLQMRDLARQFSAESYDKDDRRWELRPLVRPIYRYRLDRKEGAEAGSRDLVDGALFGFVEGTDLEVILSIQAKKTTDGDRWEYALARMSDYRLIVKQGEKVVWEVSPSTTMGDPRMAYYCFTAETRKTPDGD